MPLSPRTIEKWSLALGGAGVGAWGAFWGRSHLANLRMRRELWPPIPALQPDDRVLVVSPHLDDESLGAGGLMNEIARMGLPLRVVFMTNGDGSRSTLIAHNLRRAKPHNFAEFALLRQHETRQACAQLGVGQEDITYLGYPDGGCRALWEEYWDEKRLYRSGFTGATRSPYFNSRTLRAPYCGEALWRDLTEVFREFQPTLVLTTHPADTHPDHAVAYNFAALALETLRLEPEAGKWASRTRLWSFMVHYGIWPVPNGLHPDDVLAPPAPLRDTGTNWMSHALDAQAQRAKLRAIDSYPSQLAVTPRYLHAFARRNEIFGEDQPLYNEINACQPTATSPRHLLWPAGDLRQLDISLDADNALSIKLQLGAPPSEKLSYRVVLHALAAGVDGLLTLRRASVEATSMDGWSVRWHDENGDRELAAPVVDDTLTMKIPPALTGQLLGRGEASLLACATVRYGKKILDRTAVAVGRFNGGDLPHF